MSSSKVNPSMLTLARESRGLTQSQLAKKVGISQSALSKYENDMLRVPPEHLREIATVLHYPETFFTRTKEVYGFNSACMYHRKRQSISVSDLRYIQARINVKQDHLEQLLRSAEIDSVKTFPRYDIVEYEDVEIIAGLVRQTWSLQPGPIKNLVSTVERAGGIIVPLEFGTRKLDAMSQWSTNMPPIFFINEEMPWDRIRFSLAHEIGHLVMHQSANPNQEQEANLFASALLMPAQDVRIDLADITLQRAAELKSYWKVSMQALIHRAYSLGEITESQYRRLFTQLSKMGYRLKEPYAIPAEEPSLLKDLIDVHLHQHNYTIPEMSRLLYLCQDEFLSEYLPDQQPHIRTIK
jgi:Zn-dependent peptidase ImmA (M78 family)/DNA-binding XRE family transcriptional regulator